MESIKAQIPSTEKDPCVAKEIEHRSLADPIDNL